MQGTVSEERDSTVTVSVMNELANDGRLERDLMLQGSQGEAPVGIDQTTRTDIFAR